MSTRKDGLRTSSTTKKSINSVAKRSTKTREERKHEGKMEIPAENKTKRQSLTNAKQKPEDNEKSEKPKKVTSSTSKSTINKEQSVKRMGKTEETGAPLSTRISKTQFFPSKSMYSNALKSKDSPDVKKSITETPSRNKIMKKPVPKEHTTKSTSNSRSKTISTKSRTTHDSVRNKVDETSNPVEVSSDSSTVSERPRTATLRKGSIVNTNIVGPDIPRKLVPKIVKQVAKIKTPSPKDTDGSDESKYEDDFESYESDFEECSSSSSSSSTTNANILGEDTSSITSDSSEDAAPTELKSGKIKTIDDERKLDSGNFDLADYKHKQLLDNIKESVEKENTALAKVDIQRNNPASLSDEGFEDQKSLQFINFLDAQKKYEHRQSMITKRKRGEEILSMIRLDTNSFTLFELPPVPYETFIRSYGKSNTIQTAVQTGEDDISEEIQTEVIDYDSKWTQIPVAFSKIDLADPNYWNVYKSDYLGVGSEQAAQDLNTKKSSGSSEYYLNKFLASAGELILGIQEESSLENNDKVQSNLRNIPFSDGYILFNTKTDMFKDTAVECVSFSCDSRFKVISVHSRKNDDSFSSFIALWKISNSEEPEGILISYGAISCCSFGASPSNYVYAGLLDGTISVWDPKNKLTQDGLENNVPLFTTDIGSGHCSKVVAIHPLRENSDENYFMKSSQTNQICTLDENGEIILWTVIAKNNTISDINSSDVLLVKSTTASLSKIHPDLVDLQCTDFVMNEINSNYVFVTTNYGFILHHLVKGGRSNVKKFLPETQSIARCIDMCPFSSEYFFAGFDNGNINLYSRSVAKPLMVLSDKEGSIGKCSIRLIQWSKNKPFVLYAKDVNNTVHLWDLNESDIFPTYSVPFEKNITCLKLSPAVRENEKGKSYMMIGTDDGFLFLHQLNGDHGPQPSQIFEEHVSTFLNYVNRL